MLLRLVPRLALLRRLSQSTGVPGSMLARSPRTSATNYHYLDTTPALLTSLRRLDAYKIYPADSESAVLLNGIADDWFLMNVVNNDYRDDLTLFDILESNHI
ncbi:hypothetical protein BDR26DRAFT_858152, partial [Obelidium mucronatum]